jgi:transcription elongation GreA/GreB family factor
MKRLAQTRAPNPLLQALRKIESLEARIRELEAQLRAAQMVPGSSP